MKTLNVIMVFIFFLFAGGTHISADEEGISWRIEMLAWEKVNGILLKYSKFTVLDVETGKKFRVQRRAGSHHADVQPLNAEETKIMKSIYGGKWSWKRRAIIVINGNQWIAASMHGMPHGGGALKNNFPGHFCIHFYGSTTHRTNFMDLSHKLMILKAAGKLDGYLNNANPYEVISAFMAGLKQQDSRIVQSISLQPLAWNKLLPRIENVRLSGMPVLPAEDLTDELSMKVPVEADWFIKNRGRQHFRGSIYLVRFSQADPWKVDNKRFLKENMLLNE
ncbi:hypothetical protein BK139_16890 [Paenibacillus sp. FSL R5-0490]|uniref:hypothetical protein n=1 Tax=Bacillales TaxID=1385 RepID=UPI00096C83C5|nr:hypothetical protein [Paenibacillus sp. FSL R5-0490]OMF56087.1 hypothetical protein BK139_16890 [Paenibacillus sp. FSL R5-0490]